MFCDTFRSKFGFDISDQFLHVLHPDAYFNIDGNISDHIESIKHSIMKSIAHSIREKRKSNKSFEHSLLIKISNMKPSGPNSHSSIEAAKKRLQHMEQPS